MSTWKVVVWGIQMRTFLSIWTSLLIKYFLCSEIKSVYKLYFPLMAEGLYLDYLDLLAFFFHAVIHWFPVTSLSRIWFSHWWPALYSQPPELAWRTWGLRQQLPDSFGSAGRCGHDQTEPPPKGKASRSSCIWTAQMLFTALFMKYFLDPAGQDPHTLSFQSTHVLSRGHDVPWTSKQAVRLL